MLSIVYITCNRSSELKKSIISCQQRISMKHEYVVVDNGSTDNTKSVIADLVQKGLSIKYIFNEINLGVAGGRNIGFREAQGDICYFIDDDATIVSEGLILDKAYEYIKKNDDIMAMGTDCYDTERKYQLVGLPQKGSLKNTETNIVGFVGCSHFIKKNTSKTRFLYPNNLMYGSEEAYASRAIFRMGCRVVQYPHLKVLHNPSSQTRLSQESRKRNGHINMYIIKKYFLPFPYNSLGSFLFFLRIVRFEKFNLFKIINDFKLVEERYDAIYEQKFSINQVKELIKLFGYLAIV
jgi:GT2 family glycosyltransferase